MFFDQLRFGFSSKILESLLRFFNCELSLFKQYETALDPGFCKGLQDPAGNRQNHRGSLTMLILDPLIFVYAIDPTDLENPFHPLIASESPEIFSGRRALLVNYKDLVRSSLAAGLVSR
jgi:hypothetical protein